MTHRPATASVPRHPGTAGHRLDAARRGTRTASRAAAAPLVLGAAPAAADSGLLGLPPGVGLGLLIALSALGLGLGIWGVVRTVQARRRSREMARRDADDRRRESLLDRWQDAGRLSPAEREELARLREAPRGAVYQAGLIEGINNALAGQAGILLWLLPGLPPEVGSAVRQDLWALFTENPMLAEALIDALAVANPSIETLRERLETNYPALTAFIDGNLAAPPEDLEAARARIAEDFPELDRFKQSFAEDLARLHRLDPRDPATDRALRDLLPRVQASRRQLEALLKPAWPLDAEEQRWVEQATGPAAAGRLQRLIPEAFDHCGEPLFDVPAWLHAPPDLPLGPLSQDEIARLRERAPGAFDANGEPLWDRLQALRATQHEQLNQLVRQDLARGLVGERLARHREAVREQQHHAQQQQDQLAQIAEAQQALADQAQDGMTQGLQEQQQALMDLDVQVQAIDPAAPGAAARLDATQRQLDQATGAGVQQSAAHSRQVNADMQHPVSTGRRAAEEEEKVYQEPPPDAPCDQSPGERPATPRNREHVID
jgi:hypothetical protein